MKAVRKNVVEKLRNSYCPSWPNLHYMEQEDNITNSVNTFKPIIYTLSKFTVVGKRKGERRRRYISFEQTRIRGHTI
jgi:hypothetical protein